jgi:phosphate transport system permease protein
MTDNTHTQIVAAPRDTASVVEKSLKRRYAADRRFRFYGVAAICGALGFLFLLLGNIFYSGHTALWQTKISLDINFEKADFTRAGIPSGIPGGTPGEIPDGVVDETSLANAGYHDLIRKTLRNTFPEITGRRDKRRLYALMSSGAPIELRTMLLDAPSLVGTTQTIWLTASDDVDMLIKGRVDVTAPESERRIQDKEISWVRDLKASGAVKKAFNTRFFTAGDSRDPEQAGVLGAIMGSLFTMIVTLILSFPVGVMAAVYLEEFAPKNKMTEIIEININNLAAVPSIVFGLLGLAVFLNFFGFPRSAPLVGGMVLALMTLPTIIIAGRAALKAVPPSIREAALAVGASKIQTVTNHVLPLAMPGMLTGAIIGMAQALGETAPLLMIGMVAFIVDVPGGPTDPATVLPVQVFLWADSPERAFAERTAAAIMVLLTFLICMNLVAQLVRHKIERKW